MSEGGADRNWSIGRQLEDPKALPGATAGGGAWEREREEGLVKETGA